MNNLKKTLLIAVALIATTTNVMPSVSGAVIPEAGWASMALKAGVGVAKTAYEVTKKALGMGGVPVIGTAIASSFLPFGLGTVANMAIPYLIAAGADLIKDKLTGRNAEEKQLLLMRALKNANRKLANIRHRKRRSRSLDFEFSGLGLEDLDDYDDFDDDYEDDDDKEIVL